MRAHCHADFVAGPVPVPDTVAGLPACRVTANPSKYGLTKDEVDRRRHFVSGVRNSESSVHTWYLEGHRLLQAVRLGDPH